MCSGRGGTVEVGQSKGHLMEDGDLVAEGKTFLGTCARAVTDWIPFSQ